jgi:hypothetical protein
MAQRERMMWRSIEVEYRFVTDTDSVADFNTDFPPIRFCTSLQIIWRGFADSPTIIKKRRDFEVRESRRSKRRSKRCPKPKPKYSTGLWWFGEGAEVVKFENSTGAFIM